MSKYIPLDVLKKLPKAELHRHLDGSIRIFTVIELAKEQSVELPTFDYDELSDIVTVDEHCQSLEEYLMGFEITLSVLQKSYAITRAMYEVSEDAWNDGIRYLEIRFSPILHTRQGLSLCGVMEAIVEGRSMAEYAFPIKVNIIVCGMRQLPSQITKDLAEVAWRYRHKGVSGFDLAGPETGYSSKDHREAFDIVRRKCLNCTLHSGEGDGWRSIQDSIQFCGAHRLGHGVKLIDNLNLMKFVVDHGIAIECCVTSNFHTKAIDSIGEHPIRKYFDEGVLVVPCTDNPSMSAVTLSGEYDLIQKCFNFSVEEVVRMIDYGFAVGFMDVTLKRRLRAEVLRECVDTLFKAGFDIQPILKNKLYYDFIGVYFEDFQALPSRYWSPHINPPITLQLCQKLNKCDLHCRFDGSVSIDFVWNEINKNETMKTKANSLFEFDIQNKQDLEKLILNSTKREPAKFLVQSLLQTENQIKQGLDDICNVALKDRVTYMEIVFRPCTHAGGELDEEGALKVLLNHVNTLNKNYKGTLLIGVVVYVSTGRDDPISFLRLAKLAVKYRDQGVCGFGVYGIKELPHDAMQFFTTTFKYLKAENMNTSFFSGIDAVSSITEALSEGGARRLAGAFLIHQYPRLMNFVANHDVPIEIELSDRLVQAGSDSHSFLGNPISLFLEHDVPVILCSYRGIFSSKNRSETLLSVVEKCKLTCADLFKLLGNGFRLNFQSYSKRKNLYSHFFTSTTTVLESNGFKYLTKKHYFPVSSPAAISQ